VQIQIIGRHTEVPEDTKKYIGEKLKRLPRYYDRIIGVEVVFDGSASEIRVEILVSAAKHREFVAHETGTDGVACFDKCLDKIEEQLRRHKERVRNRKHPEHPTAPAEGV